MRQQRIFAGATNNSSSAAPSVLIVLVVQPFVEEFEETLTPGVGHDLVGSAIRLKIGKYSHLLPSTHEPSASFEQALSILSQVHSSGRPC